MKNILVRSGFEVVSVSTNGAQVIQEANRLQNGVVLCSYRLPDMMCEELKSCLSPNFEMVVVAPRARMEEGGLNGTVCLGLPLKVHELVATMEMVVCAAERMRRKRRSVPRKRSREEQELIDRAKDILMNRNGMTEEEAHRYLQKTSMDNAVSFTETAQMILSLMDP